MEPAVSSARRPLRIGLVLGAGGPVGHAYHAGVLQALSAGLGWDARHAELIVGTSAGAQVGALLRAGLDGDDLARRACGETLTPRAAAIARHYIRPDRRNVTRLEPRRLTPAAPRYLGVALRRPWAMRPLRLASALLPSGRVPLDEQAEGLRRVFGTVWPERSLWITAVHLDSGERVAFGAQGAPAIDVGTAVTCSAAVPFVCRPVAWQGRRYIDGGIASATHLDLLLDQQLDMVVISSPLSMFSALRFLLWREVKRLARKTPVCVFEPGARSLRVMGYNPMDLRRSPLVVRTAYQETLRELEDPSKHALRALF